MTIESDIIAWGLERPGWQQDVLVALANGEQYGPVQITAVVDNLLADPSNAPSQEAKSIQVKSAVAKQVDLTAVADLRGVNAPADGQRLNFATTGVTVIYGDNGSGKSGYARLIKAMVKPRHRSDILPNVFEDSPDDPSGVLHYRVGGEEQALAFLFGANAGAAEDELLRRALRGRVPDKRIDDLIPPIGADSP